MNKEQWLNRCDKVIRVGNALSLMGYTAALGAILANRPDIVDTVRSGLATAKVVMSLVTITDIILHTHYNYQLFCDIIKFDESTETIDLLWDWFSRETMLIQSIVMLTVNTLVSRRVGFLLDK